MVREISPPQAKYMTAPPAGISSSRIPVPSSSKRAVSGSKTPVVRSTSTQSSTVRKRAVLGERHGFENTPPSAHTASRTKGVKAKVASTTKFRTPIVVARVTGTPLSPSAFSTPRPTASALPRKSSSVTITARPRDSLNMSTMGLPVDPDMTQLLDVEPPSFNGLSSPGFSDIDNDRTPAAKHQSARGAGRLLTPEDSQETTTQPRASSSAVNQPSARLPTPPASQHSEDTPLFDSTRTSRVRPRPAPTPPRQVHRVSQTDETTPDPSPNPRKKKSPRVVEMAQSPSRPSSRSPRPTPLEGLARFTGQTPQLAPATPTAAELSQSIRTIVIPSTAPAASRKPRKSNPTGSKAAPRTSIKARSRKSLPAQSAAPNRRTRKSMTPAAIEALTGRPLGFLERAVEPEPGDDPLLLKADDDEEWLQTRRLSRSQSLSSSRGSQRSRRDSSVPMSQKSATAGPSRLREVVTFHDEGVSAHLSPPLESHEEVSPNPSSPHVLPQLAAPQLQAVSLHRSEATELGMSLTGSAAIDLGADSGHYDMDYDELPGWASDNDTDVGGPEEPHGADEIETYGEGVADDTFIHVVERREKERTEIISQTPSKSPNPAEIISTTPAFSPPRRGDPVALLGSPRPPIAATPQALVAAESSIATVLYADVQLLPISPNVSEAMPEDDTTIEAIQADWNESLEVPAANTTVQSPDLPVQSAALGTELLLADPVAEATPECHDSVPDQADKTEEAIPSDWDISVEQHTSAIPPESPRQTMTANVHSPSPVSASAAQTGTPGGEEDENPTEHDLTDQGDITEEAIQEDWDVSAAQIDALPLSPRQLSDSHDSPSRAPPAAAEGHGMGGPAIDQTQLPQSPARDDPEEAVFGPSEIDLAAPILQDDAEPAIQSPECRSPEAIFRVRNVSHSPRNDNSHQDDRLPEELDVSTAALTDARLKESGVDNHSDDRVGGHSWMDQPGAPGLQEPLALLQAVEGGEPSREDSMEESLDEIDAEADKVFARYISIPPSPPKEPAGPAGLSGSEMERVSSPPQQRSLLAPATPISARRSPSMTPRRFLGSPYRMVISPHPDAVSARALVESPCRSPRVPPLDNVNSEELGPTEQAVGDEEGSDTESLEDSGTPEPPESGSQAVVPAIAEAPSPLKPAETSEEEEKVGATEELVQETTSEAPALEGDGDVTVEGGSEDWDLSREERTDVLALGSEQAPQEDPKAHSQQPPATALRSDPPPEDCDNDADDADRPLRDGSMPPAIDVGNGAADEEQLPQSSSPDEEACNGEYEDSQLADEQQQGDDCEEEEAPPVRKSGRIVVRVINRGIVKVEPPSDPSEDVPHLQATEVGAQRGHEGEKAQEASTGSANETVGGAQASGSSGLLDATPARVEETVESAPAPAASSASTSEGQKAQSTVTEQSSTTSATSQPLPAQSPPPPSVHRFAGANGGAISSLDSMLVRRQSLSSHSSVARPSRLSLVAAAAEDATEENEAPSEATREPRRHARRSLGDELAQASAADDSFADGDESFRSVVEVSSMDPRAAARAAAILKLNHAYIEHGILPSSTTPSTSTIPLPGPFTPGATDARRPRSERRRRAFESKHFATAESARKLNPEELLYEAELEIVQSRRSRSRSRARSLGAESTATGWESDETEYAVPGGWKRTPGQKRKRAKSLHRALLPSMAEEQVGGEEGNGGGKQVETGEKREDGRPWGVPEWKRLEKTYRAEKEAWTKEREIKPLPGFFGWAKKALTGAADGPKEWDNERVVKRFVEEEHAQGFGGEWAEKMIRLRVKALEKRVNAPRPEKEKSRDDEDKRQGKKPRVEEKRREQAMSTPRRFSVEEGDSTVVSIVPPSTIRRMLGYVWSRPSGDASIVEQEDESFISSADGPSAAETSSDELFRDGSGKRVENKLLTRLKEVRDNAAPPAPLTSTPTPSTAPRTNEPLNTPMRQVANQPVTPAHPSSPLWSTPPIPGAFRSAFHASAASSTPSAGRAAATGSAGPATPKIYPALNPPLTQRSSAIKALFETPRPSPGSTSKPAAIPAKKDASRSVSALVRSFEEEGTFARSYEKERSKQDELRRVQSRGL